MKNGNIINIKTNYGDFYYKIYDKKIIAETEVGKLPIQRDEEILMIYTCYPLQGTGHTSQRLVVYGRKI